MIGGGCGFREECGVFGVYGSDEAAVHTALGLHALQHRGQEATGIVSMQGAEFHSHRGIGHVGENFDGIIGAFRPPQRECGDWA